MELKVLKIPLSCIELVTKTVVHVREPLWHLQIKKGIDYQFVD